MRLQKGNTNRYIGGEEELPSLNRLGDVAKLFPPSWKLPSSLEDALKQAEIANAADVAAACEEIAEAVEGESELKESAAAIACYNFDFGNSGYELVSCYTVCVLNFSRILTEC